MARTLKGVDVVVVGLGAAGGTAVWPLAKNGLEVVALEAGPRLTTRDFPFDEIRNDIRDYHGRWKANLEVPTSRPNASTPATRPVGATGPMMNAVGGTSIHWMTQSWRLLPWNFQARTQTLARYGPAAIPTGSTLADWPFTYDELEPYYDKLEYEVGTSGQAGNVKGAIDRRGNIFEGPRERPYPLPPLRRSGWTDLMYAAAKSNGWNPYPGPAGIRESPYRGKPACTYCGFCGWTGCYTNAKVSTNVDFIPQAEKTKNLTVVPLARVTEVNVGSDGRASGVTYVKDGETYFQPAKMVILAGYAYENVRLLLLSKSPAFPAGLSNGSGQVGRHFMAHGLSSASVSGLFPGHRLNRYSGTIGQFTAIDEFDADNFDHSTAGFISGGMCSATMEQKPIGVAGTLAARRPALGLGLQGLAQEQRGLGGHGLGPGRDPLLRRQLPRPRPGRARPAGAPGGAGHLRPQGQRAPRRAATSRASSTSGSRPPARRRRGPRRPWRGRSTPTPTAGRGPATTRRRASPTSIFISHEVPNLAVLGGSSFPTTGGRNPTETIQATSWRTAEYVSAKWSVAHLSAGHGGGAPDGRAPASGPRDGPARTSGRRSVRSGPCGSGRPAWSAGSGPRRTRTASSGWPWRARGPTGATWSATPPAWSGWPTRPSPAAARPLRAAAGRPHVPPAAGVPMVSSPTREIAMATATLAPTLYTTVDSPLGDLFVCGDGHAVTRLGFGLPAAARAWERDDERFAAAAAQLAEYFAGERREFAMPLRMAGSPFELRVWRELLTIPYGRTAGYGEIARRVGRPDGARAVGVANARNPVAIVVPCHRVIGASGSLTGYAGGLDRKRALLDLESGADLRLC